MKIFVLRLVIMPTILCSLISCGTMGGMGKDLQVVGKTMENAEHKRPFQFRKKAVDNSVNNETYPEAPMISPDHSTPDYPIYPQ